MAIISYGRLNKKILLILYYTITREIYNVITNTIVSDSSNRYLSFLGEYTGYIIAGIILRYLYKRKKKDIEKKKRSLKDMIILIISIAVKSSYESIYRYATNFDPYYNYYLILNSGNGVEFILMSYGTYLLLKYKYYTHHIVTMIIYCILSFSIDLILGNFTLISYEYIYCFIIFLISESTVYCYIKYMTDKLYYHYTEIMLYYGIIKLIMKILIFTGIIIYEYKNNIEGIIYGIKTYIEETNIYITIFFQFIYVIIDGALYCIFFILIIYYLRPNYLIVVDQITNFSENVIFGDNEKIYYAIIPFVIQNLIILFYFEIFELNFCNLNVNTIKNIETRERNELETRSSNASEIELGNQYLIREDKNKTNTEGEIDFNEDLSFDRMSPLNKEFEMKNEEKIH